MLTQSFFNRDPQIVAQALLGKVLRVKSGSFLLSARIIETEAYYLVDKASHASLGYTEKRKALFMPAGTIYMYYARGGDSLNVSCQGDGNAVLIKSGFPFVSLDAPIKPITEMAMLNEMQRLNPKISRLREIQELCNGQTLLCRSLGLKVPDWNQKNFIKDVFYIEDVGYKPHQIIQTTRLGIPKGRDEDLPYRFIDYEYASYCTSNPLRKRQTPKLILHTCE